LNGIWFTLHNGRQRGHHFGRTLTSSGTACLIGAAREPRLRRAFSKRRSSTRHAVVKNRHVNTRQARRTGSNNQVVVPNEDAILGSKLQFRTGLTGAFSRGVVIDVDVFAFISPQGPTICRAALA
jgi:hypothetical protein